ncbi:MAG TPA: HD domain-containing phosphohydrolase [Solirubrobacterales bacterium]|nr:HD domain-containing phosphohydrolase [Solirubrobacterales bacterium]
MSGAPATPAVELSELLGVLSFGADLGMGQPMEHVLRQCLIARGLARAIGLDPVGRETVVYASLVTWVGCHVDAYEQAKWFGDEMALKGDARRVDRGGRVAESLFMLRHLGAGRPLHRRAAMVPAFFGEAGRAAGAMIETHWRATDELMERLGLERAVRATVAQSFERWDGRGEPAGLAGERILLTARVVNLADVLAAYERAAGVEAAVAVARERAGSQFDPRLVEAFAGVAAELFEQVEAAEPWTVVAAGPLPRRPLAGAELDAALEALADFVDVKSPFTIGHSRGVAALAGAAAAGFGLDPDAAALLRRAALVHDLGRLGVPNTVWDKPGPLSPAELERARMHVYLGERMLSSSPALAPLAAVAVEHHERLDGSGYPRGLAGGAISPAGRLLAAADCYQARLEPRPHRPAQAAAEAAAGLREEVAAGLLDGGAVEAVLAAAGHRTPRRRQWPAGLTTREVEVLRLLARGRTNKEIAAALVISPKTAGTHVEHIYAKLGVGNRALASLFAARHGLIGAGD